MTPDQISAAHAMRASGASDKAIAVQYGISRQRLHKILGPRPKAAQTAQDSAAPDLPDFATELRAWRRLHGLSQSQAARLLRINPMSISAWETGRHRCALAAPMLLLLDLITKTQLHTFTE